MIPKVVIVGRPNVGKSSLLNMLCGRRVSIVDATPGVTRDRVHALAELPIPVEKQKRPSDDDMPYDLGKDVEDERENRPARVARTDATFTIELIDTGGHGIEDTQQLTVEVERQIAHGLAEADVVLFVIDAQAGVVPLDRKVAQLLRTSDTNKPILLLANKVDGDELEAMAADAARLGFGEPLTISAQTRYHRRSLIEAIYDAIDFDAIAARAEQPGEETGVEIAIVGKRNAGKSTLVNALAGSEQVIVSELEGTTRDAVDVRFQIGGKVFTAIDTAGVRKRKSLADDIEFYSHHRALKSIRRADVVMFLIDSTVPTSQVDRQLGQEILKHHKPVVVVVNKWDLVESKHTQEEYVEYLDDALQGLSFAPIVFISAKQAEGMHDVVAMALNLYEQAGHRVGTGELNRVVEDIVAQHSPSSKHGKRGKVYYVTQTDVHPPTIGMWVNDPDMFDASYQRYILNRFRDVLPFSEVPIQLVIKPRKQMEKG